MVFDPIVDAYVASPKDASVIYNPTTELYDPNPDYIAGSGESGANDSDIFPATLRTAITTLDASESDPDWDAGFYIEDPNNP